MLKNILTLFFLFGFATAWGQTPPPLPQLSDSAKRAMAVKYAMERAAYNISIALENQRPDDGVDAAGRVGYPGEVARLGANEGGQGRAGVVQSLLELVVEEAYRFALEAGA